MIYYITADDIVAIHNMVIKAIGGKLGAPNQVYWCL